MKHSILSPSSAHRWMKCPASVKEELKYPQKTSEYAQEGILAHELAYNVLGSNKQALDFKSELEVDEEMCKYVQDYVDYVREFSKGGTILSIEKKVDFSYILPSYIDVKMFGTSDAFTYDWQANHLHVFDLKYGLGVKVEAKDNPQLLLYAAGAYDLLVRQHLSQIEIEKFHKEGKISLHVVQPRLYSKTVHDISYKEFSDFIYEVSYKAVRALSNTGEFVPGESQCRFCRASANCEALYSYVSNLVFDKNYVIKNHSGVSDEEKRFILKNEGLITDFLKFVRENVFNRLREGEMVPGFKIEHTNGRRTWSEEAEEFLCKRLGEKAYKQSLITITSAEKLIGRDEVNEHTVKTPGKDVLVVSDDVVDMDDLKARKELVDSSVNDFFDRLDKSK